MDKVKPTESLRTATYMAPDGLLKHSTVLTWFPNQYLSIHTDLECCGLSTFSSGMIGNHVKTPREI